MHGRCEPVHDAAAGGGVGGPLGSLAQWLLLLLTTGETCIYSSNTAQSEPEFSSFHIKLLSVGQQGRFFPQALLRTMFQCVWNN